MRVGGGRGRREWEVVAGKWRQLYLNNNLKKKTITNNKIEKLEQYMYTVIKVM